jgi:tRNA (guanine10-N2)-dimethyltransferase
MLPPKLAQLIINLGAGRAEPIDPTCGPHNPKRKSILDPFCGTGVILQEALLMGYDVYGTDLEERMIDYSRDNLEWLAGRYKLEGLTYLLETGDATSYDWQPFDIVAGETYLGRPFSAEPKPEILQEVMSDVDTIHRKFLKNLASQTKSGLRLCIAVPAWKTHSGFKHLKVLDSLEELGYTRVSFVHAGNQELVYHREGQVVARELVVLERK